MRRPFRLLPLMLLTCCSSGLSALGSSFDFEDGTDQGFGHKFSDAASETFPVSNVAGSMRMFVARNGDFQEADHGDGDPNSAFYESMLAASTNEANTVVSYDWYIDTSTFGTGAGWFLQVGTYVDTGSGYYAQDLGAVKEVELSATQLASEQVFSGHVSFTIGAVGFDMPASETFFRLGFILNGDGANQAVYFDNVTVGIPESASSALFVGIIAGAPMRRRRHR